MLTTRFTRLITKQLITRETQASIAQSQRRVSRARTSRYSRKLFLGMHTAASGFLIHAALLTHMAHAKKNNAMCCTPPTTAQEIVTNFLDPRSPRDYQIYTLVPFIKRSEWSFQVVGSTNSSFWSGRVNRDLFGQHCRDTTRAFAVSGSRSANRGPQDWLADYFGLPPDFTSEIHAQPRAKNHLLMCTFTAPLNYLMNNLYGSLSVPFVYTDWNMKLAERVTDQGNQGYDLGYFNASGAARSLLLPKFTDFITGEKTPTISGLTFQPLKYAKINPCAQKRHTFTEIMVTLGYDLYHTETVQATLALQLGIPAGTRPHGIYLFEPISNNGRHWQLGVTTAGFWRPITRWTPDSCITLSWELAVDHLFSNKQQRTFDLKHKPLSRYMLATKLSTQITDNLQGDVNGTPVTPVAQFAQEVAPVANFTHLDVRVSTPYQLQFTAAISYEKRGFNYSFGYNFWHKSRATINYCGGPTAFDTELWALKGDAQVIGFEQNPPTNPAINLSASESGATILSGTNFDPRGASTPELVAAGILNPGIDAPAPAVSDSNNAGTKIVTATPGGANNDQTNTSIQPIILKTSDIDIEKNNTKNSSHTFFTQTLFIGHNRTALTPYAGFGAQIESGFTKNKERCHTLNCALAYWAVWLKLGFEYN